MNPGPLVLWGLVLASGVGALPIETLQSRIDQAPDGGTVVIPPGVYVGELVVGHPMALQARPGAQLVHSPGTPGPTLWIRSPGVTVEGLEVLGSGEGTRRDHTAVVVTSSSVTLSGLTIRNAWSGVWLNQCDDVTIRDLRVTGLKDFPFWERGEGVRVTGGTNIRLQRLVLRSVADGIYAEGSANLEVSDGTVQDGRYGLHLMFSTQGQATRLATTQTVVGVMVMESSHWTVRDSRLTEGYRTGSAGVREIRTKEISVLDTEITRQASGIELIDVRGGLFQGNRIAENGVAWTWGGDNTGTRAQHNDHRGNLVDFAGVEPSEGSLVGTDAHNHGGPGGQPPTVSKTTRHLRPLFDRNFWDGWKGTDLDQDGWGDTPYRFDPKSAGWTTSHPWFGVFLGSPWSLWSQSLPGGEVIDEHPRF